MPLSSARPKWLQIASMLRTDIESLARAGNDRLPTEATLSNRFGVSLMTLRQALSVLEADGLIERRRKHGTFITARASQPRRIQVLGRVDDVFEQQQSTATQVLSVRTVRVPSHLIDAFGKSNQVKRIIRRREVDGSPCSYAVNHLRLDVAAQISAQMLREMPVSQIIQQHTKFSIAQMDQELSAQLADPAIAGHLGIEPLDPVMVIIGKSVDQHGQVLDVAQLTYRADRFSFVTRVVA